MKKVLCSLFIFCLVFCGCTPDPGESTTGTASSSTPESTGGNVVVPDNPEVKFFRKVATELHDDGWAYIFVYSGYKGEVPGTDPAGFSFSAVNLRYRYREDYIVEMYYPRGENRYAHTIYAPGYMLKGWGPKSEFLDLKQISTFLETDNDPYVLLENAPDALNLEVLDEELVLRLMRQAIEGDPQPEGTNMDYWKLPSWAVLAEQAYVDGYKFQVGFTNQTAGVDAMYIDVLYETGVEYNQYAQLSDLVADGTATQEQIDAFTRIQALAQQITETDFFLASGDEYKELVIGDIDFSRLYAFLSDLHIANTEPYLTQHVILFEEIVTEDQVPPDRIPPEGMLPIAPWW